MTTETKLPFEQEDISSYSTKNNEPAWLIRASDSSVF